MNIKILSKRTLLIVSGLALFVALFSHSSEISGIHEGSELKADVFGTFSDVPASHPNYEAINYIRMQNIVEGYPDGTFRPDNPINRAEFIKIVIETYFPGEAYGSNCFPDVGTDWYAKYVCLGLTKNIIAGYPDGSFKPANYINFAEVAKILVNVNGFEIIADPVIWFKPYVEKLAQLNAIAETITHFDQYVTRGEMAEMIYRLMENVTDKSSKTWDQLVIENSVPQEQINVDLPSRIIIPAINVDAVIEQIGLTSGGDVGIPNDPDNVAWYNLGPRPGDIGNAVITGHINWYYGAIGVFVDLRDLNPGDRITVRDEQGAEMYFVVRELRIYDAEADAVDVFVSNDGKAHLNLITCEGVWDSGAQQYTDRLVVFTDKVV